MPILHVFTPFLVLWFFMFFFFMYMFSVHITKPDWAVYLLHVLPRSQLFPLVVEKKKNLLKVAEGGMHERSERQFNAELKALQLPPIVSTYTETLEASL